MIDPSSNINSSDSSQPIQAGSSATSPASAPSPMPVFHKSGVLGFVPNDKFAATVATGDYEPAVMMTAPDGTNGYVPRSKVKDTLAQPGYSVGQHWTDKSFAPPAESGNVLTDMEHAATAFGSGLKHMMFYEPAKGETVSNSSPELQIAKTMVNAGQQAIQQHQNHQDARAVVSGLAALDPFAAGPVSNINALQDANKPREALTNGVLDAGMLGLGSDMIRGGVGDAATAIAKKVPAIPDAIKAAITRTPDQILHSAVRPKNTSQFAADAKIAVPRVAQAGANLGMPIRTADDVLTAVKQAKSDLLTENAGKVGPDGTLADLSPDDAANMTRTMDSLTRFENQIRNAKVAEDASKTRESNATSYIPGPLKFITSRVSKVTSKLNPAIEQVFTPLAPDVPAMNVAKVQSMMSQPIISDENTAPAVSDLSVTPANPPGVNRVPLWKQAGVQSGQPPVQTPTPMSPVTPRAQRADLLNTLSKVDMSSPNVNLGGMGDVETGVNRTTPVGKRATPANQQGNVTTAPTQSATSDLVPQSFTFGKSTPLNGESAAREFLTSQPLGWLKNKATARGILFNGAEAGETLAPKLINALTDSLTPEEIDAFENVQRNSQPAMFRRPTAKTRAAAAGAASGTVVTTQDLLAGLQQMADAKKAGTVPQPIADAVAAQSRVPDMVEQITTSGHPPNGGAASLEELARGVQHWIVDTRNGKLTYLGVSPDAGASGLRSGQAIVSLSKEGRMNVVNNNSGLSDGQLLMQTEPTFRREFPERFRKNVPATPQTPREISSLISPDEEPRLDVIHPSGQTGTIPVHQLSDALGKGYRLMNPLA